MTPHMKVCCYKPREELLTELDAKDNEINELRKTLSESESRLREIEEDYEELKVKAACYETKVLHPNLRVV